MIDMSFSGAALMAAAFCVGFGLRVGMDVASATIGAILKRWLA